MTPGQTIDTLFVYINTLERHIALDHAACTTAVGSNGMP